jgi:hypothetical protein
MFGTSITRPDPKLVWLLETTIELGRVLCDAAPRQNIHWASGGKIYLNA